MISYFLSARHTGTRRATLVLLLPRPKAENPARLSRERWVPHSTYVRRPIKTNAKRGEEKIVLITLLTDTAGAHMHATYAHT